MKRRTLLMSSSILPAAFAAQAVSAETTDNSLTQTDPDFSAIEQYLLKVEMPKAGHMPVKTRCMVTLATLTTVGGLSRFADATEEALKAAKKHGVTVSVDLNFRKKLWSSEKAQKVMTNLMKLKKHFINVLLTSVSLEWKQPSKLLMQL